jgi:ferric iron reductase protein FhuF
MVKTIDFSVLQSHLRISPDGSEDAVHSIRAAELLKPEAMEELLSRSAPMLKATSRELPASFIGLAFFNICAAKLLLLSQQQALLDLSLDNLVFELIPGAKYPQSSFRLIETRYSGVPQQDREAFVQRELAGFFEQTMNPIVASIAAAASIKTDLIWNQYGGRMIYINNFVQANEPREDVRALFARDYELLRSLAPEVFGRRRNPFIHQPRYIDSLYEPGKPLMIKSSCCHYDKREEGIKCYSCPRATESERIQIREKLLAAAAAK